MKKIIVPKTGDPMDNYKTDSAITVIKGKFKATATSSFGLFIAFMDNNNKNIEKFDVMSSHFSTVFENNMSLPWNELEEMITQMKWRGEYATNLTHDIQSSFEDLYEPGTGRVVDIWQAMKRGALNKVVAIYEEYLIRPTGDKNVKCDIMVETIHRSDIEKIKEAREMRDNQAMMEQQAQQQPSSSNDLNLADSSVVLDVSPVLSPINGTTMMDLKPGTKVLVKISEESSRGQYFIDLFNASVDNEILPIPASVESVSQDGKFYKMIVGIGPGIYGKILVEDNVKVKLFDATRDTKVAKTEPQDPSEQAGMSASISAGPKGLAGRMGARSGDDDGKPKNLMLIVIGGGALLLLIIIVFLMI